MFQDCTHIGFHLVDFHKPRDSLCRRISNDDDDDVFSIWDNAWLWSLELELSCNPLLSKRRFLVWCKISVRWMLPVLELELLEVSRLELFRWKHHRRRRRWKIKILERKIWKRKLKISTLVVYLPVKNNLFRKRDVEESTGMMGFRGAWLKNLMPPLERIEAVERNEPKN